MTAPSGFDGRGSQPKIETYDQLKHLHQAAADAFCELVYQRSRRTGRSLRISLSGGSTPKRLYELLAERRLSLAGNSLVLGGRTQRPTRSTRTAIKGWCVRRLLSRVGVAGKRTFIPSGRGRRPRLYRPRL